MKKNKRNTSLKPANQENSTEDCPKDLIYENKCLTTKNLKLSQENALLKQEVRKWQQIALSLKTEKFDLEVKCNNLETLFINFKNLNDGIVKNILDTSEKVASLSQLCNLATKMSRPSTYNNTFSPSMSFKQSTPQRSAEKLKVVKPHTVNGHILRNPTIELTRVNDLGTFNNKSNSFGSDRSDSDHEVIVEELDESIEEESEEEMETEDSQDHGAGRQLDPIMEQNEDVSSPSKTSILSGLFHDVKIYLNQTPKANSNTPTSRRSTNYDCSPGPSRATSSPKLGNITVRNRQPRVLLQRVSLDRMSEGDSPYKFPTNVLEFSGGKFFTDNLERSCRSNSSLETSKSNSSLETSRSKVSDRKRSIKKEVIEESSRPRRAARPRDLREPSLSKKMRRNN